MGGGVGGERQKGRKGYGDVFLSALIEFWFIDNDPASISGASEAIRQLSAVSPL